MKKSIGTISKTTKLLKIASIAAVGISSSVLFARDVKSLPTDGNVQILFPAEDGARTVNRTVDEIKTSTERGASSGDVKQLIADIARAIAAGPTENEKIAGVHSALPEGATLENVEVIQREDSLYQIRLDIKFPDGFIESGKLNWEVAEEINETYMQSLDAYNVMDFLIYFYNPKTSTYVEPIDVIDPEYKAVAKKFQEDAAAAEAAKGPEQRNVSAPPAPITGAVTGGLSGKTVVLNQSHGFLYENSWRVQRTKLFENVEDFSSPEFINMYVIPALMNAGAMVKPVREPDLQSRGVVVDNPATVKTGSWSSSTANGYVYQASFTGTTVNPFGTASATDYSSCVAGATPTASAKYVFAVPANGYYNAYISYASGTNRTTDARYVVGHSGGEQEFRVNQQKNGATWVLLGNFYFEAGAPEAERCITVYNNTSVDAGKVVSIDAARIGGGLGVMNRRGTGVSGLPAWQEEAMHYMQYTGFAASTLFTSNMGSVDENNGWSRRPAFAQWEQTRNNDGNNTVYLGWHTNAYNGSCSGGVESTGTGTGVETLNGSTASTISKSFTTATYNAYLDGVKKFYNSSFASRGMKTSTVSEANQANMGSVAGTVFEGLFHDKETEVGMYKDPKFRMIAARALTQGIISYYGGTVFPPEPPVNFRVKNLENGQVQLNWNAGLVKTSSLPYGHAATGYRIYKSKNGFGFDSGTVVGNINSYVMTLQPGEVAFFRVVATNTGGVSFPSETLGVGVPSASNTKSTVLIVNGFDRQDRFLPPITVPGRSITSCAPNSWRNVDYRRFNSFNYVVQHGKAIAAAGYPFDSTSNEPIGPGTVDLKDYAIVDWIGGQEAEVETADSVNDEAFTTNEMTQIQNYLNYGGRLFVSNSKLGWDFGRSAATTAKRNFYNNFLKATHVADSAGVTAANNSATGIFNGIGTINFNGDTEGTYNPEASVIAPTGGAITAMTFSGGSQSGQASAIQYSGKYNGSQYTARLVNMNFGFETIRTETTRNTVMDRILNYFDNIPTDEDRYYVPTSGVKSWDSYTK